MLFQRYVLLQNDDCCVVALMSFYAYNENFPMQLTEIFLALKIQNIRLKDFDIFLIFAQNIDSGYTLEPPPRGGSNEYPQSMFWSKNKKNTCRYTPAYPSFAMIKMGFEGVHILWTCFPDVNNMCLLL